MKNSVTFQKIKGFLCIVCIGLLIFITPELWKDAMGNNGKKVIYASMGFIMLYSFISEIAKAFFRTSKN